MSSSQQADPRGTAIADIAVLGLGVMGQNLALNLADHGATVAVWNRSTTATRSFCSAHPALVGAETLAELVAALKAPRKLLVMVKAGAPMDELIGLLRPLLSPGDLIIDGGNTWFEDTRRREAELRSSGLRFFGMGVSGGEEGARHGPSLMPGGDPEAYASLRPLLESIAAKTDTGPCVTWCGPDGAGHFVKMVHNGIEYADMQLIAEVYDLLRKDVGLSAAALGEVFSAWNEGPLASFLVEITAAVLKKSDDETGRPLVDLVTDEAGQKGTGRWTASVALELGVPIPAIAAAVDARGLSANRAGRAADAARFPASAAPVDDRPVLERVAEAHDALLAAKICAYAQGMKLLGVASATYGWNTPMDELARIWKGGCIIRARLLDAIRAAYAVEPKLANLLHDPVLGRPVAEGQGALRRVVARAALVGVPVPAFSACLAWFDALRSAELPQNLTQAQRDAFGAHTFVRRDDPGRGAVHVSWI